MSDMAILRVKNRDFQRSAGRWLHRAKRGDTVVIVGRGGPPLTLSAGPPERAAAWDWDGHFAWLRRQPVTPVNPVDAWRKADTR
jgi:antitoxin (DNA-binding transcriptional repressor) of toxin-antitoxin stability system